MSYSNQELEDLAQATVILSTAINKASHKFFELLPSAVEKWAVFLKITRASNPVADRPPNRGVANQPEVTTNDGAVEGLKGRAS